MSRSKRKPYASVIGCKDSNKKDKQTTNRHFRRHNKMALLKGKELLYKVRECSDVYNFNSDGLDMYIPTKDFRNDPDYKEKYLKEIQRK